MACVSTYLNFPGNAEEAFRFYERAFGTSIAELHRFGEMPPRPGAPELPESVRAMAMHVMLPILGGHQLMGTDAPREMGFDLKVGNNSHVMLQPDSREEADRLFAALSEGGQVEMPLQDVFWGAYYGSFADRFGVRWMVNVPASAPAC